MSEPRIIGIDLASGLDRSVLLIGETLPDGSIKITEVDDVIAMRRWGTGYIIDMQTRDSVLVRADGTCHMLVTKH